MNFIIYIGLFKTGSTFFNEKILKKIKNENTKIFTQSYPGYKLIEKLLGFIKSPQPEVKNEIKEYLNSLKETNIIILSEAIFGHQANGFFDVEDRLKNLESLFQNPKYIIFFREPSEIILSGYNYGLRKLCLFDDFVKYTTKNIESLKKQIPRNFTEGTNYKLYNYNLLFNNYLKIKERVLFVNFDELFNKDNKNEMIKIENFAKVKFNIKVNFNKKVNYGNKYLFYFPFYNQYFIFKVSKLLIIKFFSLLEKSKISKVCWDSGSTSEVDFLNCIVFLLEKKIFLLNFFLKKINFTKLIEYKKKNINHVKYIENYHKQEYDKFCSIIKYKN